MGRTTCPACGANVDVAVDHASGERVVLEVHTDASSDADRYRVVSPGPPMVVERVLPGAAGDFYPSHFFDCPDFNAGRSS